MKLAKNIIVLITLVFILSCKYNEDKKVIQKNIREVPVKKTETLLKKNNQGSEDLKIDCFQLVLSLIQKSNFKNPFKENLKIEIIDNNGVNMKLRLFDANDKSENTVGWIVFDAENMRLLDITNDDKNPEKLKFDKIIWNKIIACLFNNDRSFCFDENEKVSQNEDCKKIIEDMDNIEECLFKNTNLKDVYNKLVEEHGVNDSEFLSKVLPKSSEIIAVNQKGIMNIEYKVMNNTKVEIIMNYQGGITIIELQKINNNVKQIITYSAD